jgi:AcrR family transcriptional regulator
VAKAGTSRGAYSVGVARRARIIRTAAEEFARGGFYNTSLARIAELSGLTDAGLGHHFANKQQLLLAVVQWRHQESREWWSQFEQADTVEFLGAFAQAAARDLAQPGLIELFVTLAAEAARPDHPAQDFFVARYRETVAGVALGLRLGVERGRLRSGLDVDQLAAEIIAVSDGLQLQWMLSGRTTDLVAGIRAYTDRLTASLLSPGSDTG